MEEISSGTKVPRRSLERQVNRSISDVSAEVRRGENSASAIEIARCECCGLIEECTPQYISKVKELFGGHWICGLCEEAVREEGKRMGEGATLDRALTEHMSVCVNFNKFARNYPALCLADAMKQILKKKRAAASFRPNGVRSGPNSPSPGSSLSRTSSCIPAFSQKGAPGFQ